MAELEGSVIDTVAWTNEDGGVASEQIESEGHWEKDAKEVANAGASWNGKGEFLSDCKACTVALSAMTTKGRAQQRQQQQIASASASKGKKKRLQHEAYLARVRTRAGSSFSSLTTTTHTGLRQAWYAVPSTPEKSEPVVASAAVTQETIASMRAVSAVVDHQRVQARKAGQMAMRARRRQLLVEDL